MAGIAPRNETEAMLAAQMVAVHAAAIAALRRLKGAEMITQLDSNGNLAIKLLRTFTTQVETLQRLRGKEALAQQYPIESLLTLLSQNRLWATWESAGGSRMV